MSHAEGPQSSLGFLKSSSLLHNVLFYACGVNLYSLGTANQFVNPNNIGFVNTVGKFVA